MADALVGATIQVLLEKSISLATERIGLIVGFKEELQSLRESVEMILAVLADAEVEQRHNQAVQRWLKKLEGVAFDADNVLDEINYEVLRRKVESLNQLKGKEAIVSELKHLNDDVVENCFLKESESFKKQYAAVPLSYTK